MHCLLQVDGKAPSSPLLSHHFFLLASFALQLWDTILGVSDEVTYIWRKPLKSINLLYLAARYGFLGFQCIHQVLVFQQGDIVAGIAACKIPILYRAFTVQIAVTLSEVISLLLLSFLFSKSRMTKLTFGCIFVLSLSCEISATSLVVVDICRSSVCILELSGRYILFSVGAGLFQCCLAIGIVVGLVVFGHSRTPLSSLILKNSFKGLALTSVSSATIVVYNVVCAPALRGGEGDEISNIAYSWFLAVLSTMMSRLLLNFRKRAFKQRNPHSDDEDFLDEGRLTHPTHPVDLQSI